MINSNLDFLELNKDKLIPKKQNKEIEGSGIKKQKHIKKTKYNKGNASLKQLLENLKIKKEKQKFKDEISMLEKQKEYYKLMGL